jgi:SHS2 domain-containing protein
LSEKLDTTLGIAYDRFVERIVREEQSDQPIGILRPGILGIMRKIIRMRPIIKGVAIYSNNRYLPSLHFIRDIIHRSIGTPVIGPCIHWNHSCRSFDQSTSPHNTKSWDTLHTILVSHGAPENITAENVFFFDDQQHPSLQEALQFNYYKVPEYTTHNSFERIAAIYTECLEEAQVNIYELYGYLTDVLEEEMIHLDATTFKMADLLNVFRKVSRVSSDCTSCSKKGIRIMKDALEDITIKYKVTHGSLRRTRRNRRHTLKK